MKFLFRRINYVHYRNWYHTNYVTYKKGKHHLCLCLTFLSSVFRLFFCCFYSLYSLLFWPYFSSYCLSDPTFPFLLLLYSLYSLLFWPYFSFSSAAARKVKQRHKTAFLSRFHQKVEEIHFKLEKTVKNRYSWLIWSTRFARTSKRHSYGFSVLSRWKRISSTFREILTGKRLFPPALGYL